MSSQLTTPAQQEAMNEVRRIMNLHFPAWHVCGMTESADGESNGVHTDWHGNFFTVKGMMSAAEMRLDDQMSGGNGEEDDEEEAWKQ